MPYLISREQLRSKNSTYLFQGREQQDLPISFFWVQTPPGDGPRLYAHPYPEIFVVQEGHATFTVGEDTIEVEGGHVLIGPAEVPHKFVNSGEGILLMVTIHPSKETIGRWLED
jgi:mannose-6-phosphate isomerase-like protein (cupin superfamily)